VIGANRGIVNHSTVHRRWWRRLRGHPDQRAEPEPGADDDPACPSSATRHVLSRTDMSQDVNDRYLVDARSPRRRPRPLRTSLLKQLAGRHDPDADRQPEGSDPRRRVLDPQRRDDARLAEQADQPEPDRPDDQPGAWCRCLLTITTGSSGFTLHRALHDAGRVLVVVAGGVALIGLAAFVPIAFVLALTALDRVRAPSPRSREGARSTPPDERPRHQSERV